MARQVRDPKQQVMQDVLRSFVSGGDEAGAVENLVSHCVHSGQTEDEILKEIVKCFLRVRESLRQSGTHGHGPSSRLISAFGRTARSRNIDEEELFRAVLERLTFEGDEDSMPVSKSSTKDRILDAALTVFSEKGFHLATVDEIAERAGVGKGTLYRYFANKETLFNELVRLRLEALELKAMTVVDGQDDVLTLIRKYLLIYFEFFDRNKDLYRLIAQERPDVGEYAQDLYFKKVMRRIPHLKRKIYEASQQGILKEVDFQTVFYGVMGFVHGVIQKWVTRDCSYSLMDELPGVVEVLFYGFVKDGSLTSDRKSS